MLPMFNPDRIGIILMKYATNVLPPWSRDYSYELFELFYKLLTPSGSGIKQY